MRPNEAQVGKREQREGFSNAAAQQPGQPPPPHGGEPRAIEPLTPRQTHQLVMLARSMRYPGFAKRLSEELYKMDTERQKAVETEAGQQGQPPAQAEAEPQAIEGLSSIQLQALAMLAAGKRIYAIAQKLSVDRATIYRWKRNPAFAKELERLTRDMRAHVEAGVLALADDAIATLVSLMDEYDHASARLGAATFILQHALAPKKRTGE